MATRGGPAPDVSKVELELQELFDVTIVAAVAKRLDEPADSEPPASASGGAQDASPLLVPCERQAELSFAQQRLWFLDQYQPGSALYNIPEALRLEGTVDAAALERAFSALVRRHESLRTTFQQREGGPVQIINPAVAWRLEVEDLRQLPGPEREGEALRLAREEARRPFDLSRGPLLRTRLLRLAEREHLLLVTMHHIVSDGWSTAVLVREVARLYEAFCQGRPSPLPELSLQYAEFARDQRELLQGEVLERQLAWWKRQLEGVPAAVELPTDRPRPPGTDRPGAVLKVDLPVGLTRMLRGFCRAEGATLFMGLLAGLQLLLSRYSGQRDVCVGVPVAGRTRPELDGLIGFFVNTLVLRTRLEGDPTFRELLARVKETTLGAYAHQDVPFEKLVEVLQPPRHAERTPFFQVALVLHNTPAPELELPGLRLRPVELHSGTSKFDFALSLTETPEGLSGRLEYRSDLYAPATAARMMEHLVRLLEGALAAPGRRVSELPLLSEAERRRVLEELATPSEASTAQGPSVLALIEARASLHPERPAVACEEQVLTYGELDARANQLAWHLRSLGVGPESRVALCLSRPTDTFVALLASWKAGGAYVPLDPEWPAARLAALVDAVSASVVITESRHTAALASGPVRAVALDTEAALLSGLGTTPPPGAVQPDHAAYVLFTSGSTGQPRGVVVEHAQLLGYVQAVTRRVGLGECASFALVSTFVADLGNTVLFPALCTGGLLHVPTRERASNPAGVADWFQRHPVDCMKLTPSHLAALLTAPEPRHVLPRRRLVLGGEPSSWALLEEVRALAPDCQVFNHYGPTETTVGVLAGRVELPAPAEAPATVPLGRPLAGTRLYLLDEGLRPVPAGVPGELYVGGAQVTRGYLGRPELTAERYVPDPYSPVPGARMYRTGDRARWLRDGQVEFLGRADFQVKVRGFRVEPGEVEAVLRQHAQVREALVVAREDSTGDKRLVAYVVPREQGPSLEALRAHAASHLPGYMVPPDFVVLEALPLTSNGKVDRAALPAPESRGAAGHVAPRTSLEARLSEVFAEVLRLRRVGVTAGFFELGGHSLLATQLVSRIRTSFGVELPLRAVFETPTVEELARRLERLLRAGPGRLQAPPLRAVERIGPLPLSFAQQRLWFLDQLQSRSTVYNAPVALRLEGTLDEEALRQGFQELVRRHESLRTTFRAEAGQPHQVISGPWPLELPVVDLTGLDSGRREAEALRLALEEAQRPFNLSTGPLLRVSLFRLAPEAHVLVLNVHHIVSDAWSSGVLVREVVALYEAFRRGQPSPLPALRVQYADYAAWQRGWLRGDVLEGQLAWWRGQLEGASHALELPTDRPRPALQSFHGARHPVQLSGPLSARLKAFCQREGVTPFMALLASWQLLLSRYSGQDDVSVGTPIAGRRFAELEDLIGFFINMLVLRARIDPRASFRQLLAQVRTTTLGAFEHQDVPFEKLVEELQPQRDLSRAPLFQVSFALQNAPMAGLSVPGLSFQHMDLDGGVARFELTLLLSEGASGFTGIVEYNTDLFDASTVARMMGHLEGLLEALLAHPEARLGEVPLLSGAERQQVLEAWNQTASGYPREAGVHQRFGAQAARTPDAVAVESASGVLTYRELDERSNQLAHHLRALGVAPGTRVGLCLERSPELVVGLLGILKAGAAFVPLEPSYPAARLDFMVSQSGVSVLVTQEALAGMLPGGMPLVVCLDSGWPQVARQPVSPLDSGADADSLAYVMFTSGSTGQPKGVAIPHRGITRLVLGGSPLRFGPEEVFLQLAPSSFDASTLEVWGALLHGARLVLFPPEPPSLETLGEALVRHRVTTLWLTAALYEQMVVHQPRALASVRQVLAGGDVLSAQRVREHLERLAPGAVLVNGYGPTENTTFTCCHPLRAGASFGASVPIGRPVSDTRVYVLDGAMQPVPVGVPGELYTGGDGLAWGYLGRADLTAERFVPSPFGDGERLYRTGDRVRWLADGTLEFLGRGDDQVKVRGFRIEPGEVEGALRQHPRVREAVVVAREGASGDKRLVAYAVAPGTPASALRDFLRQKLPEYMVPSELVLLDALPLSPNGKVERRALPAPAQRHLPEREYAAPRNDTEERLAALWGEVLGVARVGIHDDFFELGGHSLLATQLVSRVRQAFGLELGLRELFEAPTVAQLAGRLTAASRSQVPAITRSQRERPLTLSFAQQRLWFLAQLQPGALYNVPFILRLDGALDLPALQQSFQQLVHRHESLRTLFLSDAGQPIQVVTEPRPLGLTVVDLSSLPPEQREAEALRLAREEARRPFELSTGPLLRVSLFRLAAQQHVLVLSMHHIVSDGWSMGVLVREVVTLYEAFCQGRPSPLPELPLQYADYVVWQRGWLRGEALEEQLGWWKQQLQGVPSVLELPTDKPRPAVQSHDGAWLPVHLPRELTGPLLALCQREGVTPFMVLLAGWQLLLSRYSGQDDIAVGSPIAGRTRTELEGLIGFFVNTLVLRTKLDGQASFRELLARVRTTTLAAYEHQDLPFEKLVEELQPQRSLSHTPLFQVMLVLQNTPMQALAAGPLRLTPADTGTQTAKFDLTLTLAESPEGFSGTLGYRTDLFEPATVARMARHLEVLLQAAVSAPETRVGELPLMGADERRRVLAEWNDTRGEWRWDRCLHERFEVQAALTPGALAVLDGSATLSFDLLNRRANQLAHALRLRGAGPEVRVALCLERGVDQVVAVLAVLKSGAAYVPMDPAWPRERRDFTLRDCGARLVLTQQHQAAWVEDAGATALCLDAPRLRDILALQPDHNPSPLSEPGHLAYVIYTSGSTGRPKGVQVQHGSVMNLRGALARTVYADVREKLRVSLNAPLAFDASVKQLIQVADGHALCVVPQAVREAVARLKAWVEEHGVDVLDCSPAHLRLLLDEGLGASRPLRVLVGGEAVDGALWARLASQPNLRAFNMYGPTECTVDTTVREVRGAPRPTLGRPLANVRVYVLDAHLRPVPVGVPGELYIGGAGVARGYLGRPDLTAGLFVPDAFSGEAGARLYRSGDKVRWLAHGELEYLGRVDFQVKLRGLRIELGEVEKALERHPSLKQAVVVAREDTSGLERLVAYVVPHAGQRVDAGGLRTFLQQWLPTYMVPAAFVPLDALPLNSNGKLERAALPRPERVGEGSAEAATPHTAAEEQLVALFAQVLRVERVGIHDDFFALGGHSLLATQLLSRVQRALGVELPLRALFEEPTVAGLARLIEDEPHGPRRPLPPLVRVSRDGPAPLSFSQERMWRVVKANPSSTSFNQANTWRFEGQLDAQALQAAFQALAERHESLRTTFLEVDGRPVQQVARDFRLEVPMVDLRGHEDAEAQLRERIAGESRQPYDLSRGPLVRATLFRLKDDEHLLLLCKHHIISDGWSQGVLTRELAALYTAFSRGEAPGLAPLKFQYPDYATWLRGWLAGAELESRLGYWRKALSGAPTLLDLPTDKPRPATRTFNGATVPLALGLERSAALQALCRQERVTPFMALLALYGAVLSERASQQEAVIGSPIANRPLPELEPLIGLFINTLALRVDVRGGPTFRQLLSRVRDTTLGAYAHQEVPFEYVVDGVGAQRLPNRTPLFQTMFVLQSAPRDAVHLPGLTPLPVERPARAASIYELTLVLSEQQDGFGGGLEFNTDLFEPATAQRLCDALLALTDRMLADPDGPVGPDHAAGPGLPQAVQRSSMEDRNRYRNSESMIAHGNPSFQAAKEAGLLHLSVHNTGRGTLELPDGREFINMCSCSYLGLDSHPDVIDGAIEVLRREKTMDMAISRLRIRLADLDVLEGELSRLWRAKTIVTTTASYASAGLLPLIASGHLLPEGKRPVVVFDKAAHFSMNLIKPICADETEVLTAPHNDMNFLEDVCRRHARVAYIADGFYSMGGAAIVKELFALQDRYGLFLYFDDSHSLSVYGNEGQGFVRTLMGGEMNPRTIIIGSLGKGFGTAGGAVMLGPGQYEDLVGRFGGPLGWSQSLSIPAIGAGLASARLHGTPELARRQQTLRANIRYFDERVPTRTKGEDFPIKIIDVGPEALAVERSRRLLERGFYSSAVFFPIVPKGRAGLRIMLRSNLSREDLQRLCDAVLEVAAPTT